MININCYNCGSDSNEYYANENGFTLVKCNSCGLLFVNPRPKTEDIDKELQLGVHKGEKVIDYTGYFNPFKVKFYLKMLKSFYGNEFINNKKTWLDIGCGYGEFLKALKQYSNGNILARGIEPNIKKQILAKKKNLDVSFFDTYKHFVKYDFISLLNVYSHLPDPVKTISSWKHLLKPEGELLLETGDTANLDSKQHYKPFHLPYHLSFASESIIINILEKNDFKIIGIIKYPPYKLTFYNITKEIVKIFLPEKKSYLVDLFKYKNRKTDMYIRARLKS